MAGVVSIPDEAEKQRIRELHARFKGNISAVAREVRRDRATVRKVLQEDAGGDPAPSLDATAILDALRQAGFPVSGQFPGRESEPKRESVGAEPERPGWVDCSPPKLVRSDRLYSRIVALHDIHFPYHSQRNLDAACSFVEDWKPEVVILNGDAIDAYGLSRFSKDPKRRFRLQEELDIARPFFDWLDARGCDVVYILGNHEDRIRRTVLENPGFDSLRALEFKSLAELPERWTVLPDGSQFRVGGLSFAHGNLKGCGGGIHVAANILRRLKTSCVVGHHHKEQRFAEPSYDRTVRTVYASGHLCDESQADYIDAPMWTEGFVSVEMDPATDCRLFGVNQHTIYGGRFRHGGKTYSG